MGAETPSIGSIWMNHRDTYIPWHRDPAMGKASSSVMAGMGMIHGSGGRQLLR
jgi:hypothetical protein